MEIIITHVRMVGMGRMFQGMIVTWLWSTLNGSKNVVEITKIREITIIYFRKTKKGWNFQGTFVTWLQSV